MLKAEKPLSCAFWDVFLWSSMSDHWAHKLEISRNPWKLFSDVLAMHTKRKQVMKSCSDVLTLEHRSSPCLIFPFLSSHPIFLLIPNPSQIPRASFFFFPAPPTRWGRSVTWLQRCWRGRWTWGTVSRHWSRWICTPWAWSTGRPSWDAPTFSLVRRTDRQTDWVKSVSSWTDQRHKFF